MISTGESHMAYEAPMITEAGRFADVTLGSSVASPFTDNTAYWSEKDPGSR
jgi:hypothetical protein